MSGFSDLIKEAGSVAIAGHVNPDGDCTGAALGLWIYLRDNYPELEADVYLQEKRDIFSFLKGYDDIRTECEAGKIYDLLVLVDISSRDRVGVAKAYLQTAKKVICIDHHFTNNEQFDWFLNEPGKSSASEVLFCLLDEDRISYECAEALFTGIVHDTGAFQYSCTSPETMRIAAKLMEYGIPYTRIIDESFFQKTLKQNRVLGKVLCESELFLNDRVMIGYVDRKTQEEMDIDAADTEGIVSLLRYTRGVDVAVFIRETETGSKKISVRTTDNADASAICASFGGGGHKRAAGALTRGEKDRVIQKILAAAAEQLDMEESV